MECPTLFERKRLLPSKQPRRWLGALATLCLLVTGASAPAQVSGLRDLMVVVNTQSTATNVTLADLEKVVRGEKSSFGGAPVQLVLLANGAERDAVLRQLAHSNDTEFKKLWVTLVFRNEAGVEPVAVPSRGIAIDYVSIKRGGIAFISTGPANNVKVLKVDGRLPGEAGYPLHW